MIGGRTHVPRVDSILCRSCGVCSGDCPASVFTSLQEEEDSLRGRVYKDRELEIRSRRISPCRLSCPIGQDVPAYIRAIADSSLEIAARIIRQTNALPNVCGRLCTGPCMLACRRGEIDGPVDIRGLKEFVAKTSDHGPVSISRLSDYKVAIVGSGPSGLAAAHYLVLLGTQVVVYEKESLVGGALVSVIPEFVLPQEAFDRDVSVLRSLGIQFETSIHIGKDISFSQIADEFDKVIIATGAPLSTVGPYPGRELHNVFTARDFCIYARANAKLVNGHVVVRGGDSSALLAARTALRLTGETVSVVYPYPLEKWPAGQIAVHMAIQEGVRVFPQMDVVSLDGTKSGKVKGLMVRPAKIAAVDRVGRLKLRRGGKKTIMNADVFVDAGYRYSNCDEIVRITGASAGVTGNILVNGNYQINGSNWYAAGEVAGGQSSIINAMGMGRLAARNVADALGYAKDGAW